MASPEDSRSGSGVASHTRVPGASPSALLLTFEMMNRILTLSNKQSKKMYQSGE